MTGSPLSAGDSLYASSSRKRYEIRPKLLLMTNRKLHNYVLSIGTKVVDLGHLELL